MPTDKRNLTTSKYYNIKHKQRTNDQLIPYFFSTRWVIMMIGHGTVYIVGDHHVHWSCLERVKSKQRDRSTQSLFSCWPVFLTEVKSWRLFWKYYYGKELTKALPLLRSKTVYITFLVFDFKCLSELFELSCWNLEVTKSFK